ncbi:unnamed protein product [Amaranthus hypochondriacus]
MGSSLKEQLPAIVMVSLQCVYGVMALLNRAALVKGMNPRVFMLYRQALAFSVMSPIAFLSGRKSSTSNCSMGIKTFFIIFATAFVGVVMNQTMYFEGLYMASSSIASAMTNLVPAVTFLLAAILGLEQVQLKSISSMAKMLGTGFCVIGAGCMALLRGPKLLNIQLHPTPSNNSLLLNSLEGYDTWIIGCLFIFASMCCWSVWLILQVPITRRYPDHLSLSAWMCFLSMLQSLAIAWFSEHDPHAWNLTSTLELSCIFISGVFGSGIQFFAQAWCISKKGPLYSAMFNPLCTVITTILACIFLHEQLYVGSLLGAFGVIIGLYTVLWGKAREMKAKIENEGLVSSPTKAGHETENCNIDLEQPLLADKCHDQV